jgi:hypothetical protein
MSAGENPLFLHLTSSKAEDIRRAVDQLCFTTQGRNRLHGQ